MKLAEVKQSIISCHKAGLPLALWGAPGIGKTAIVQAAAEELRVDQFIPLRVNLLEAVDFGGYPYPVDGRMDFLLPKFMPQPGVRGVLFLDELPQAPMATQCAAMRLVDNLPEGWQVVAAGNRITDGAGANSVATHVLSRFTHIDVEVDKSDWQRWASDNGVRSEVRGFIDFRPGLLFSELDKSKVQKERGTCSPRTWHRVSMLMDETPEALLLPLVSGTVGPAGAAEFMAFLETARACATPEQICANPEGIRVSTEASALYAVSAALVDYVREDFAARIDPAMIYINRMPVEFGVMNVIEIMAVNKKAINNRHVMDWCTKNAHVLTKASHARPGKK